MFDRVKGLMQTKEVADQIVSEMKKQQAAVSELKKEISSTKKELSGFRKTFEEVKKSQDEFFSQSGSKVKEMDELKSKFSSQLTEFNLMKDRMQERIVTKVDEKLREYIGGIKLNLSAFDELAKASSNIKGEIAALGSEIRKLNEITKKIDAKDFELDKYARELSRMDSEKLALLRKIDTLEKLISAERRRKQ